MHESFINTSFNVKHTAVEKIRHIKQLRSSCLFVFKKNKWRANMFKKTISFLMAMFISLVACNALNDNMELLDGDFGYILNEANRTAIIKTIYIPTDEKKDLVVPKYVSFHSHNHLVIGIQENAIRSKVQKIKSFMAREDFINSPQNFHALTWLVIFNIPIISVSPAI